MPVIVVPAGRSPPETVMPTDNCETSLTALMLLPDVVRFPVIVPVTSALTLLPEFAKVTVPVPDESSVAPSVPIVNRRVVESLVEPTYLSVPPLIDRFAAVVSVGFPRLLAPLASLLTDSTVG